MPRNILKLIKNWDSLEYDRQQLAIFTALYAMFDDYHRAMDNWIEFTGLEEYELSDAIRMEQDPAWRIDEYITRHQ